MKRLSIFILLLTIVASRTSTDDGGFTDSSLRHIATIIQGLKTAKDTWSLLKDLPPSFSYLPLNTNIEQDGHQDDDIRKGSRSDELLGSGKDQKQKDYLWQSTYDFIVDLTRPTDIYGQLKAYLVVFPSGKQAYDNKTRKDGCKPSRFIVNVVGRYNVGKTYVLRLLTNINLGHSFIERTHGISVSLPTPRNEYDPNIALIDTAGARTPVEYNSTTFQTVSYERQVSDAFIREVALNSSEVFLFVVNHLTLDDQLYLKMLYKRLKVRKPIASKNSLTKRS